MSIQQVYCTGMDNPTLPIVEAAQEKFSGFARETLDDALAAVNDLQNFAINPYEFNVTFNPNNAWWNVVRPAAPLPAPNTAFNANSIAIDAPPSIEAVEVELDAQPTFDAIAPTLAVRVAPTPFAGTLPMVPAAPAEPDYPSAPNDAKPIKPTLVDTIGLIPEKPTINTYDVPTLDKIGDLPPQPELAPITPIPDLRLVLFDGVKPVLDFEPPPNTFSFTPETYTSVLKGKIESRLSMMLDGGTGLPWAVVQQLRDRAYAAVDVEERRNIQSATEEYSSRGFTEPSGLLTRRLSELRQDAANRRSGLSRDIYLEDEKIAVENMRFAVTQGVAFESALSQAFVDRMRIALDAAKAQAQIGIDLYNARASVFNLQLEAYKTDAQVYATLQNAAVEELRGHIARTDAELRMNGQLIDLYSGLLNGLRIRVDINTGKISNFAELNRAEAIKIDLYRAEAEAVRIVGELNSQRVSLFGEEMRALLVGAQVYDSGINAANKLYDGRLRRFDVFKDQVQGFVAQVGAKNTEWEGFTAQLNADTASLRPYELYSQVFGTRTSAWKDGTAAKIDAARLKQSGQELNLTGYRAKLDMLGRVIDADRARVGADVDIFRGSLERYRADAEIERIVADGNEQVFRLGLEQQRVQVETAFKNIELEIQQLLALTTLDSDNKKAIAQLRSQVASAALSAVNYSAGVSGSYGQSVSCSTGISYSTSLDPQ